MAVVERNVCLEEFISSGAHQLSIILLRLNPVIDVRASVPQVPAELGRPRSLTLHPPPVDRLARNADVRSELVDVEKAFLAWRRLSPHLIPRDGW